MHNNYFRNSQFFIPTIFDECFTYEKQILWLKGGIVELKEELENLKNQGSDPTAVLELQVKVTDLEVKLSELQTKVSELEASEIDPALITELQTKVSELEASEIDPAVIAELQTKVSELEASEIDPAVITELQTKVSELEASEIDPAVIAELQTEVLKISLLELGIENLQLQIDSLSDTLSEKQDSLTFDLAPTSGSSNPVTSNGVFEALQSVTPQGGGLVRYDLDIPCTLTVEIYLGESGYDQFATEDIGDGTLVETMTLEATPYIYVNSNLKLDDLGGGLYGFNGTGGYTFNIPKSTYNDLTSQYIYLKPLQVTFNRTTFNNLTGLYISFGDTPPLVNFLSITEFNVLGRYLYTNDPPLFYRQSAMRSFFIGNSSYVSLANTNQTHL